MSGSRQTVQRTEGRIGALYPGESFPTKGCMINLEPDVPMFYWTYDELASYPKEDTAVWYEDALKDPLIRRDRITFDYPSPSGLWPSSLDPMAMDLEVDGKFHWRGTPGWKGYYWGVRSETHTHVFLTGRWRDDDPHYGQGVFIATFPKKD
jgi:hypothetical protein